MAVETTDIKFYKTAVSDSVPANNGGRKTATESVGGVSGNIFPTIQQSERVAGSTKYRKIFIHNRSVGNETLYNPMIFIENPTPAEDRVTIFPGTATDTEADITGSERLYGCGWLSADASIDDTTITVTIENAATQIFVNGDKIRISDKATVDAGTGNEEIVTINSAVGYAGTTATITFTPALTSAYSSVGSATRVASLIESADIETGYDTFVVTSPSGGNFTPAGYLTLNNRGTETDSITCTFTSGSNFNIVGAFLGSMGAGSLSGAEPLNSNQENQPYFSMASGGFSGSFATNDTITFNLTAAAIPIWYRRDVPAGTSSYSGNSFVTGVIGESE